MRIRPGSERILAMALVAVWMAGMLLRWQGIASGDFAAPYLAGQFWAMGRIDLVYPLMPLETAPEGRAAWATAAAAAGHDTGFFVYDFIYPPIWAVLAAPLHRLTDLATFGAALTPLNLALMALAAWRLRAVLGAPMALLPWMALCLGLLALTDAGLRAIWNNQPQIAVLALTVLALDQTVHGRHRLGGGLLGLAAAIKLTPGLLILWLLADRRFLAAGWTVATAGLLALASVALTGPSLHVEFLEVLGHLDRGLTLNALVWTLETQIYAMAHWGDFVPRPGVLLGLPGHDGVRPPWLTVLTAVLGPAILALATWRTWRMPPRLRRLAGLPALALAVQLVSTGPSWSHTYLLPVLALPALPAQIGRPGWALGGAVALAISFPVQYALMPSTQPAAGPLAVAALIVLLTVLLAARPESPCRSAPTSAPS